MDERIPPITTVARGRCTSAPVPIAIAIGTKPNEATKAVISTGRKRVNAPSWIATSNERVVILEDTRELNCAAEDCVNLRTKPGVVSLSDLVRSTLRLRPDRIVVGEVRGAEALDMLKAWNTGHPGGLTTVHANSARGALYRLEQLVQEAVVTVPRRLIAEALDILVFLDGRGSARRLTEARATPRVPGVRPAKDAQWQAHGADGGADRERC